MASKWKLLIEPLAARQFAMLQEDVQLEAVEVMEDLLEDPLPPDHIAMKGYGDTFRLRFCRGRYRIVYRVVAHSRKLLVKRIGPRETVYQGLRSPRGVRSGNR